MQNQLFEAFQLCLSQNIKEGERILKQIQMNVEYPDALIDFINQSGQDQLKIIASIEFKNWANKYKDMESNELLAYELVIQKVKAKLIDLILNTHKKVASILI